MKKSKFIIGSLILFSLALLCGFLYYPLEQNKQTNKVNFFGVEIPEKDLGNLINVAPEGVNILCSIDDNKCVYFFKSKFEDG